jgi:hypothetical protein
VTLKSYDFSYDQENETLAASRIAARVFCLRCQQVVRMSRQFSRHNRKNPQVLSSLTR